jgi:hypothetical protein
MEHKISLPTLLPTIENVLTANASAGTVALKNLQLSTIMKVLSKELVFV